MNLCGAGYELLTDLYQITMAQGYWEAGKADDEACFHMYFRDYPFKGGYAVACGMAQLAEMVDGFAFSEDDCAYLASLPAPGGGSLFEEDFLDYLANDFRLTCNIDAVVEGTVVFPHEPLVRVTGPIMQCQLLETALLNCVNFQTLIATKAARVCLAGIRIDSGDLAWLAKMARRMLDEAGLADCGIVLSNDLDEHTIQSIRDEGAQVMSWGVGTKLACAYDQPTLGGVYKLSATRAAGTAQWHDCLKISESAAKLTVPGVLDVRRYYHADGRIAGDMVFDVNAGVREGEVIVDPCDDLRQKRLAGKRFETLLHPLAREGRVVLGASGRDALAASERARAGLGTLDESQKRMLNPHSCPVGLERGLSEHRRDLVVRLRGLA